MRRLGHRNKTVRKKGETFGEICPADWRALHRDHHHLQQGARCLLGTSKYGCSICLFMVPLNSLLA